MDKAHRNRGRAIRRVLSAVALGAAALALTPAAQAGTYDVYSCKDTATGMPLGPANPSGWVFGTSHPGEANWNYTASCDSASGAISVTPIPSPIGGTIPGDASNPRAGAMWFVAPASTVVRAYEMYRAMHVTGQRAFVLARNHQSGSAEFCHGYWEACLRGDSGTPLAASNRVTATFEGTGADTFNLQLLCDGVGCEKSSSLAGIRMFAAKITLEENERPTFSSPPAGTLLDAGNVSGTRTLDFVGADVGSGLHEINVTANGVDGQPAVLASKVIDSGNGRCAAAKFAYVVPCPLSIDDSLEVDTLQFDDGEQTVTITLEDAAGNTRTVQRTVTIRNAPSSTGAPSVGHDGSIAAGDVLTCNPGTFSPAPTSISYAWLVNGSVVADRDASSYVVRSVDVGKSIVCRVTAVRGGGQTTASSDGVGGPGQPGSSTGSNATTTSSASSSQTSTSSTSTSDTSGSGLAVGAPNGTGGDRSSARFTSASRKTVRSRYGRMHVLSGKVVDAEGRAIAGAVIDVLEQVRRPGQGFAKLGTVQTDSSGVYTYKTPAGPSRTIRFAYAGRVGSSDYRDTADVLLRVKAVLRFRVARSKLRAGQSMRLRGRVLGGQHLPKRAVVEVQARDGRVWRTIAVRRVGRGGKVSWRYRFRRTRNATFLFRVVLRAQPAVPLDAGRSRSMRVHVR